MAVLEIVLSKGANTVTVYTTKVEDGFQLKLFKITPARGRQTQSLGPQEVKVVDLLRLTRTFRVNGWVDSNTDKGTLISIIEGGGIDGGPITFTFSEGGDSTSFTVFVETCIFTYDSQDEPDSPPSNHGKHAVNLTLIKGVQAG